MLRVISENKLAVAIAMAVVAAFGVAVVVQASQSSPGAPLVAAGSQPPADTGTAPTTTTTMVPGPVLTQPPIQTTAAAAAPSTGHSSSGAPSSATSPQTRPSSAPSAAAPSASSTDPARQAFTDFWGRFTSWAATAGSTRTGIKVDMGIMQVDGIYRDHQTLWQDCRNYMPNLTGVNGGPWAQALITSPDPTLAGIYRQMTDTIRVELLACMNGDSWLQLTDYETTLATLQGNETGQLNSIHQQAERYGLSWQWPQAFPVQGV